VQGGRFLSGRERRAFDSANPLWQGAPDWRGIDADAPPLFFGTDEFSGGNRPQW